MAKSYKRYTVAGVFSEPLVIGMASETPEQIELLELAQSGDEQACRELLLDVADRLERYITDKMPQKHQSSFSAEDVLRDVLSLFVKQ